MAWIESHQELERHPKTLNLMASMGWDLDQTLGKLHRFWYWCVDYAPDGDLRKYNDATLAIAVGLNPLHGKSFVDAMVSCGGSNRAGFIDRKPYFRVHDWWDTIGEFLKIKYKNYPEKWQQIKESYRVSKTPPKRPPKPEKPNLTIPNQTKEIKELSASPLPKSPYRVDLKAVVVCDLDEPAKHKLYNQVVRVFQVRGWDVESLPLKAFQTVAESVTKAAPRETFPYFYKALEKHCNENSEVYAAQSRLENKKPKVADSIGRIMAGIKS